jgi:DNA-directed RNA polymerase specialized sigma24 family protein
MPDSIESSRGVGQASTDPGWLDEQGGERQLSERRLDCLERCLAELSPADRELIDQYYRGETRAKIENRRRLAEERGIPLNALRIRMLRIREKLEACVQRRLNAPPLAGETTFDSAHRQAGEP